MVLRSSAEVEYKSMVTTTCEVTCSHEETVLMYCDNQAALHISANLVFHERSKHIKADCHIVRNKVLDGTIKTFYVPSKNQLANIFTKVLGVDNFLRLLKRLGIINIFAHSVQYPEYTKQNQEARALLLRGIVENKKQGVSQHQGATRCKARWFSATGKASRCSYGKK